MANRNDIKKNKDPFSAVMRRVKHNISYRKNIKKLLYIRKVDIL